MGFLILAIVLATVLIAILWYMNRPTSDPVKSVDSFQQAIRALDPAKRPKIKPVPRRPVQK